MLELRQLPRERFGLALEREPVLGCTLGIVRGDLDMYLDPAETDPSEVADRRM